MGYIGVIPVILIDLFISSDLLLVYESSHRLTQSWSTQAIREKILQLATQAEKEYFDSLWTITRILWPLKPQPAYVHEIILLVAYHVSLVFPEYTKTH